MDEELDSHQPDEYRPVKRQRLEGALEVTETTQEEIMDEEDWDDIYEDDAPGLESRNPAVEGEASTNAKTSTSTSTDGNDGLRLQEPTAVPLIPTTKAIDLTSQISTGLRKSGIQDQEIEADADAVNEVEELVKEEQSGLNAAKIPSEQIAKDDKQTLAQGNNNNDDKSIAVDDEYEPKAESDPSPRIRKTEEPVSNVLPDNVIIRSEPAESSGTAKVTEDAEFMAAAAVQKGQKDAEWQFDSSDAESSSGSSDSSDSSDESDDESEDGYEMLDPATAAKILMAGEDGDDDGEGRHKGSGDNRPRTQNEVKEVLIPKPDIKIDETTKITELGLVENVVDNLVLVKGATPGEYQVLEAGSALCNANRKVIGAVMETFGRVQEPLYMVQFATEQEIADAGLVRGARVFYVNEHSTFVFTQPLKNLKGTDASNIHDEEVAEDEMEFSDDEAEAEYKRQKKMAKKAARGGGVSGGSSARNTGYVDRYGDSSSNYTAANGNDAPSQTYGGGMSYDDEPTEEFYQPLKRPDNLSQMMAGGNNAGFRLPQNNWTSTRGDRGRGRGDRGRGDRGRGRGGSHHDRGQGGRGFDRQPRGGGYNNNPRGGHHDSNHRGNAQSFPDRHNHLHPPPSTTHVLPSKPLIQQQQQQQQHVVPPATHYPSVAAPPQTYNFNGYTFQYGNPAPPAMPPAHQAPPQSQPPSAMPPFSPGAYVNPAFFANPSTPNAYHNAWTSPAQPPFHSPASQPHHGAPGSSVGGQNGSGHMSNNLADILRQLNGQQQQG